jgi:methylated-DNA-[protein]-cysteine S-methyltransferase
LPTQTIRTHYLISLDFEISLAGTAFQQSVWQVIDQIPFGQSLSYADIATAIGNPKAVRAVGAAVGANPVPIRIGCHRVLGSNASITGYSGGDGIPTKRWLLEHESIQTKD